MIIKLLGQVLLAFLNFIFTIIPIGDFGLSDTFDIYTNWFSQFTDSITSLIAFLIPRPVFISSVFLFVFIHELDHALELANFILRKIPGVRILAWRGNTVSS